MFDDYDASCLNILCWKILVAYMNLKKKNYVLWVYRSFVHPQNTIVFLTIHVCHWDFPAQYVVFRFDYWKRHQQTFILYCLIAGNLAASWKLAFTKGNLKLLKIRIICLVCMNNVKLSLRRQVQSHFSFRMQYHSIRANEAGHWQADILL